ncbi:MAG TPA: hypothetical protein VGM62_14490 [Chthoniobacterales bacterium]
MLVIDAILFLFLILFLFVRISSKKGYEYQPMKVRRQAVTATTPTLRYSITPYLPFY